MSRQPVLPDFERESDWGLGHREGVIASLAPEGASEAGFPDLAKLQAKHEKATALWRLTERFDDACSQSETPSVEVKFSPEEAKSLLEHAVDVAGFTKADTAGPDPLANAMMEELTKTSPNTRPPAPVLPPFTAPVSIAELRARLEPIRATAPNPNVNDMDGFIFRMPLMAQMGEIEAYKRLDARDEATDRLRLIRLHVIRKEIVCAALRRESQYSCEVHKIFP